jgi:hyperosmotically inducible protein
MLKRIAVLMCSAGVVALTSGYAAAQAADKAQAKTQATADKAAATVSDAEITTSVKSKLAANKTVSASNVDVDTSDGVVTLTGTVHSAAARTAAARLARQAKGVKRVENKLTVETAGTSGKSDKGVDVKVKDDLKQQDDAKAKVVIKDDTTPKVKAAGRATADATITAAVKTKLATVKGVIANDINVDTNDGVVTLKGSVPEASQKARAEEVARNTTGVKRVVNELTVK